MSLGKLLELRNLERLKQGYIPFIEIECASKWIAHLFPYAQLIDMCMLRKGTLGKKITQGLYSLFIEIASFVARDWIDIVLQRGVGEASWASGGVAEPRDV